MGYWFEIEDCDVVSVFWEVSVGGVDESVDGEVLVSDINCLLVLLFFSFL